MKVSDFDYILPEELIALKPIEKRDESRLLLYNRANDKLDHRKFKDIVNYLKKGDCLVLNDTKVIPARLLGKKVDTGGSMEFVLLNRIKDDDWRVLVRPGKRAQIGTRYSVADGQ